MIERLIKTTQGKGVINTAFIERLNATFRQRINPLTRRTRTLAQRAETLLTGIYIVGCFYNFCDFHHSLRLKLSVGSFDHLWVQRIPAIASGLTDHQWTPAELLNRIGICQNSAVDLQLPCSSWLINGQFDHI